MKLKLGKQQILLLVIAVVVLCGLLVIVRAGGEDEAGTLDSAASRACADFADGYPEADSTAQRLALADRVTASSSRTDNDLIRQRAAEMGDSANGTATEWRAGADGLRGACREAGWAAS